MPRPYFNVVFVFFPAVVNFGFDGCGLGEVGFVGFHVAGFWFWLRVVFDFHHWGGFAFLVANFVPFQEVGV
jgi:hypothetical protein